MEEQDPYTPRPEYPRPQFVRSDWLNLNGVWEFAFDDADVGLEQGWAGQDLTYKTTLKPGQTLTGTWAVSGQNTSSASFDFRPNLAAAIPAANVHFVTGASATNCPGHGQADPGHLCIYQYFASTMTFIQTNYADSQDPSLSAGAGREGFVLYMSGSAVNANAFGSWAVTPPAASASAASPSTLGHAAANAAGIPTN